VAVDRAVHAGQRVPLPIAGVVEVPEGAGDLVGDVDGHVRGQAVAGAVEGVHQPRQGDSPVQALELDDAAVGGPANRGQRGGPALPDVNGAHGGGASCDRHDP
jgi:hypothetical protein